ncbi:hypothetical protein I317_00229 [Kwoniella heveanensis CBS 569]|nr:hypothetical protein I317_00229 [Kwoniella heveanensis CBS 569]
MISPSPHSPSAAVFSPTTLRFEWREGATNEDKDSRHSPEPEAEAEAKATALSESGSGCPISDEVHDPDAISAANEYHHYHPHTPQPHQNSYIIDSSPNSDSLYKPLKAHLTMLHPETPPAIIAFCATRLLSRDRPYGYTGEDWTPLYLDPDGGRDLARDRGGENVSAFNEEVALESSPCGESPSSSPNRPRGPPCAACSPSVIPANGGVNNATNDQSAHPHRDDNIDIGVGVGFDLLTAGIRYKSKEDHDQCASTRGKKMDERLEEMYKAARESWDLLEMKGPNSGCRL